MQKTYPNSEPRKEKNEDDSTDSVNSTSLIRGNLPPRTRVFPDTSRWLFCTKTSHGKPASLSHQSGFSTRALMNRGDPNFPLRKSPSQNENEMCQTSTSSPGNRVWIHASCRRISAMNRIASENLLLLAATGKDGASWWDQRAETLRPEKSGSPCRERE